MSLPIKQGQKAFSTPQSLKLQIKPCVPAQKMHSHIQQFKGLYLRTMSRDTFNKSKKNQNKKNVIKISDFTPKIKYVNCKYIVVAKFFKNILFVLISKTISSSINPKIVRCDCISMFP